VGRAVSFSPDNFLISEWNMAHFCAFWVLFLADRTIGRAYGTVCRLSVCRLSVVCLWSVCL